MIRRSRNLARHDQILHLAKLSAHIAPELLPPRPAPRMGRGFCSSDLSAKRTIRPGENSKTLFAVSFGPRRLELKTAARVRYHDRRFTSPLALPPIRVPCMSMKGPAAKAGFFIGATNKKSPRGGDSAFDPRQCGNGLIVAVPCSASVMPGFSGSMFSVLRVSARYRTTRHFHKGAFLDWKRAKEKTPDHGSPGVEVYWR
jgi:hypothetical protein